MEVRYSLRHIHLLVVVVHRIGCCVDVDCIGLVEEHRHMKESVRSVGPREMPRQAVEGSYQSCPPGRLDIHHGIAGHNDHGGSMRLVVGCTGHAEVLHGVLRHTGYVGVD